jgi:hypothetical protein
MTNYAIHTGHLMQGRTWEKGVGGASCAAAPSAKMGSHTNISDIKIILCAPKFLY